MTEQTRYPILHIPESEVPEWYELGWSYVGPSDRDDFSIIKWEGDKPAVRPFRGDDELAHIHGGAGMEAVL